jgi:hypothetical protein
MTEHGTDHLPALRRKQPPYSSAVDFRVAADGLLAPVGDREAR